jgi:site-specific DNA recombinase
LGKQVARPREEWIAVDVPAIINQKVFDTAQKRLDLNKQQSQRNAKREYLMGRRLRCLKCGYTYVGRTRREKHQYYVCNGRQQLPVSLCDMPNFRADQVDDTVWGWIKHIMQHPDQIADGLRAEKTEAERANSALSERLALIDGKLTRTRLNWTACSICTWTRALVKKP